MQVQPWRMVCPQCGAPLEIESGRGPTICRYCGSQLYIGELGDRPVTRARQVDRSDGAQQKDAATARPAEARPILSQLERECTHVQSQLASVEAEIGSLERQQQTEAVSQQLCLLRAQKRVLRQRLASLLPSDSSAAEAASASRPDQAHDRAVLASVQDEILSLDGQQGTATARQQLASLRVQERALKARLQSWQDEEMPASVASTSSLIHRDDALKSGCLWGLVSFFIIALIAGVTAPDDGVRAISLLVMALLFLGFWTGYRNKHG